MRIISHVTQLLRGGERGLDSQNISRASAEGLCQALACEMFSEFRVWFDAHPELRPYNGDYPNITASKLTAIPMHYRHPTSLRPFGFTGEIPAEIRKEHPNIKLSCKGQMYAPDGNRLSEISFNGETRVPGSKEDWTF